MGTGLISKTETDFSTREGFVIKGFLPTSLNEWNGRIAAVIFLENCNMRCPFCHGWRFVTGGDELPEIKLSEVITHLAAKKGWIDGVVISGGEPTISPGLEKLVKQIKDMDLEVKLHSNGLRPEVLEKLINDNLLDCLSLDYKSPLEDDRLKIACGVNVEAEKIRKSFEIAGKSGLEVEFHTTLCPEVIKINDLVKMAKYLKEVVPVANWFIQQYNCEDVLDIGKAGTGQYTLDKIEKAVAAVKGIYPGIKVL